MPKILPFVPGTRFNHLTLTGVRKKTPCTVECICDCGFTRFLVYGQVYNGKIKSCARPTCEYSARGGRKVFIPEIRGESGLKSREYRVWTNLTGRMYGYGKKTYNPHGHYGIAKEFKTFVGFIKQVGLAPSQDHALVRINRGRGYELDNVHWIYKPYKKRIQIK